MDNEQLLVIKKLYNKTKKIMNNSAIHISLLKAFPTMKHSPDKIFWFESLKFMAYISNADGIITQKEVNVMNYITGTYFSKEDLIDMVENDHFIDDTANKVPLSVKILCAAENMLYEMDCAPDESNSIMNGLVLYFTAIGKLVADADDNISGQELVRINEFIQNIKDYIAENTLSPFFEY